ncbi:MAG: hypothetical protein VYE42_07710 [Actinomycetota bacterium]|nr:hypothetical protein [Actinomycetota bacterium]
MLIARVRHPVLRPIGAVAGRNVANHAIAVPAKRVDRTILDWMLDAIPPSMRKVHKCNRTARTDDAALLVVAGA